MALKAVLGSLDGLPEDVRRLYAPRQGRFVLDVEAAGGLALEDVAALKNALSKERVNAREARRRLAVLDASALESAGFRPGVARGLSVAPGRHGVADHEGSLTETRSRDEIDLARRVGKLAKSLERVFVEARDIAAVLAHATVTRLVERRPTNDHDVQNEGISISNAGGASAPPPLPPEA
jgi:hypothetical protein